MYINYKNKCHSNIYYETTYISKVLSQKISCMIVHTKGTNTGLPPREQKNRLTVPLSQATQNRGEQLLKQEVTPLFDKQLLCLFLRG